MWLWDYVMGNAASGLCVRFWEGSLRGEGLSSTASLAAAGGQADAMAGLSALGDHGGPGC